LNKEQNRGKIAQILTGEGKTLIIISLAIIMVLKGHKVDIVTSNPLLAKRDSEESKELFEYFGITVGNNIDSPETLQIFKKLMNIEKDDVYTKDVIYGTTFEYQGDILKDEYELSGIRRNRGFDIVIVDEIDCMLIDEYASKTRLAKSKPFLEKYSIFLYLLWSFYKDIALEYNLDEDKIAEDQETREKLSEYLTYKIKKFINIENENSKYYFPMSQMNKQFALNQVDNWVNNLINCLKMKQNVEYIIKDNDIVPVDQDNTGVIQKICNTFSRIASIFTNERKFACDTFIYNNKLFIKFRLL
jgi:preprotein translocase subunit SecA